MANDGDEYDASASYSRNPLDGAIGFLESFEHVDEPIARVFVGIAYDDDTPALPPADDDEHLHGAIPDSDDDADDADDDTDDRTLEERLEAVREKLSADDPFTPDGDDDDDAQLSADDVSYEPPGAAEGPPHPHDQSDAAYTRDRDPDGSPRGIDVSGDDDDDTGSRADFRSNPDGEWKNVAETDESIKPSTLGGSTGRHELLTIIAREASPDDEEGVPANELRELMTDHSESTVGTLAHDLWCRRLVDRRKAGKYGGGYQYAYRPNALGVAELDRVGEYDQGTRDPEEARKRYDKNVETEHFAPQTHYHAILTVIRLLGATPDSDVYIRTSHIADVQDIMLDQSVSPTLSRLHDDEYVARRAVDPSDSGTSYEYRVTERGMDYLDEYGLDTRVTGGSQPDGTGDHDA